MESLWSERARLRHARELARGLPDAAQSSFAAGSRVDVAVVGAGLTGLVTALLLARSGHSVAVLEARHVGAVTTGNTTAKLSLLQGSRLQSVLRHRSLEVARAYVDANVEGREWLLRYCADHGVDVQRRDAVSYATTDAGAAKVRRELRAAHRLGLGVDEYDAGELPFSVTAAIRLRDQGQFDPLEVLDALARDVRAHGGVIYEGVTVTGASAGSPVVVRTTRGELRASRVVLASGIPVLDRGLHFSKLVPQRSYALAFAGAGRVPEGMYLSLDASSRSLRTTPVDGETRLLVGGNGHITGRSASERAAVDELEAWAVSAFPGAVRTHAWSAQDYEPISRVPHVGVMPRSGGRILVATGYDKWGMTNSVAAALALSESLLGGHMEWARRLYRPHLSGADIASAIGANASVAVHLARGYASALSRRVSVPQEGEGSVGRAGPGIRGVRAVGASRVDGVATTVSAVCPHLGGILAWNDAELSWDCPLHGSRFDSQGRRLEGPAVCGLRRVSA